MGVALDERGGDGVIRAQRFAARAALSGTVFLAGWVAGLAGFGSPGIESTHAAPIEDSRAPCGATSVAANREPASQATTLTSVVNVATADPASPEPGVVPACVSVADMPLADPAPPGSTIATATMSGGGVAMVDPDPSEPAFVVAGVSAAEVPVVEAHSPMPPPQAPVPLASLFTSDPAKQYPHPAVRRIEETPNECLVAEICIDEYLWSLYERTPKIDTNKVTQRIKMAVKKKGKTRTVVKTMTKYVVGDFTWKDPIAAQRAGMSLKDYASAFRDDYRQSIAAGRKAASDSSYHGGSRRGGYGHGLAVDLVSVKGDTRMQRYASSQELWKWLDAHEKELGVGRPYRDRDPPHVGPIDGKEYIAKRGGAKVLRAGL
jgi:hypothetical protein